jgi:hypothetical protein
VYACSEKNRPGNAGSGDVALASPPPLQAPPAATTARAVVVLGSRDSAVEDRPLHSNDLLLAIRGATIRPDMMKHFDRSVATH